jgi:predicted Rossmann-fold nucleotide-binding protein
MREIDSIAEFDRLVAAGAESMAGWRLENLDLRARGDTLRRLDAHGLILFGCELDADVEAHLRAGGALLFPDLPGLPFEPYRVGLYEPQELYDAVVRGGDYPDCMDARCYAWARSQRPHRGVPDVADTLAASLHDHAITDAVTEALRPPDGTGPAQSIVAIMGGHALRRGTPGYLGAAQLGRELAGHGTVVATGGGPGAMEAANLGAWLAHEPEQVLVDAVTELAEVPGFEPSVQQWVLPALRVRSTHPAGPQVTSLSVPTWYYGHEPPNVFAHGIAKYFSNALREDVLLHTATRGVIVLPGAGGTVGEIFQMSVLSYYDLGSQVPLILVGQKYWTQTLPVWPLLQAMAAGRPMENRIALVDAPTQAVSTLRRLVDGGEGADC